jgi:type IV pilus assembly protein PilB
MDSLSSGLRPAHSDAPAVHYLQQTFESAHQLRASDIHFEPFENFYRVRLRIDGVLQEITPPPFEFREHIASRIKVLAHLDIAEKRLPQDGRMSIGLHNAQKLHLRISTLPTLFGEKLVVRILSNDLEKLNFDRLGYPASDQRQLRESLEKPHGMILVTGPTGSGKSQSLYACLHLLNKPEINIASVEDPSEIQLPGINQVNVKEKIGLNFATTLRAFLRQDPDVLMVGEIRDHETADMAVKASQTGHLVLSTLHTEDAPSALVRLRNMGMATYNLASSISLISAQRLVRRLCRHCKVPALVSNSLLKNLGWQPSYVDTLQAPKFFSAHGCAECHKGYWGRIGIFQLMPITPTLQHLILQDAGRSVLTAQAEKEGVLSLRHAGLLQAALGITSISEVLAHTTN